MKIGDTAYTPRFCTVRIVAVFSSESDARAEGFSEPTHYENPDYEIFGKHAGTNRMIFAAIKK